MFRFLSLSLLLSILLLTGVAQAGTVNFNGKTVGNCTLSGTTYNCGTAFLGATDTASIFTGYTVIVNGSLQLGWEQGLKMTGTARLETTGNGGIRLSGANPNNINISGGTIKAAADFVLGGNRQDITADVIATTVDITGPGSKITGSVTTTGAITVVSRSEITGAVSAGSLSAGADTIFGSSVTTTGAIILQSRTTVAGAVNGASIKTESGAILKGAVKVSGLADFESGSSVTGNVDAGSLTLRAAGTTITGNVNVSGDVTMGSSTVINGDLVGNNVKTQSSSARINGNALVYSLYLAWDATVSKVVTCKVPADFPCSCVTYESGYNYRPTCAAATPSTAHHFQITHGGNALTCQAQTVTVTACANAACTAPHYTGAIKTTLQPGGAEFTVTGGVNNAATVSSSTAGLFKLSASGGTNGSTCVNTSGGGACDMVFSDSGLIMSVPDHVSMTTADVTIRALQSPASPNEGKTCLPLLKGATPITFSCTQVDPANGAKPPVKLKKPDSNTDGNVAAYTDISCGSSGGAVVSLNFDESGTASAKLLYPEVGTVRLDARYTKGTLGASGNDAFTVAPKAFRLKATRVNTTPTLPAGVFARASEQFTLQISAINALADDPGNMEANVTTNFGLESTNERMLPTFLVIAPTNGVGALTGALGKDAKAGTMSGTFNFDDVGTIRITAINARTTNYMGVAAAGFDTKGVLDLGRFIPDHFDTSLPKLVANPTQGELPSGQKEGVTMDCAQTGGVVQPCTSRLVYSGQPFYAVVSAYNGATPPALTRNYRDTSARTITLSSWSDPVAATAKEIAGMSWLKPASATRFNFSGGIGMAVSDNLPYFAFSQPSNPTRIFVRAVDTDLVTSRRSQPVEQELTAISGQLYIAPNFGSATSPIPMQMEARFYNNGAYRLNPAFQGPTPALTNSSLVYSNCQKALAADPKTAACNTAAQIKLYGIEQPAFVNGKTGFRLQGPGTGPGAVGISVRAPCAAGATCAAGNWIDYLPATVGTATFGIYRSGPVIYTREVY